jgi:hypothetical protein
MCVASPKRSSWQDQLSQHHTHAMQSLQLPCASRQFNLCLLPHVNAPADVRGQPKALQLGRPTQPAPIHTMQSLQQPHDVQAASFDLYLLPHVGQTHLQMCVASTKCST